MNSYLLPVFKIVAFFEGLSYILLVFIAVPIKYLADDETYVKLLGMPHGILFVLYLILALFVAKKLSLTNKKTFWLLAASVIPLATFFVERWLLKERTEH